MTFGAFARRTYANDNPLIGYPLAYQYLTSLRPDAVPATADALAFAEPVVARGDGEPREKFVAVHWLLLLLLVRPPCSPRGKLPMR